MTVVSPVKGARGGAEEALGVGRWGLRVAAGAPPHLQPPVWDVDHPALP